MLVCSLYRLHRDLAVSLHHISSTAIGRIPLSFLGSAVSVAPARKGARFLGASPFAKRFMKAVHHSSISSLCSVDKQFFK